MAAGAGQTPKLWRMLATIIPSERVKTPSFCVASHQLTVTNTKNPIAIGFMLRRGNEKVRCAY